MTNESLPAGTDCFRGQNFKGRFVHSAGLSMLERLADAQRGDVIAWALATSTPKPGDTGHVVLEETRPGT